MAGDFRVLEIKVLSKLSRADEAKQILEKVCWQVQPIMKKRRWRVPLVVEFLPRSANLLGLNTNAGEQISIRVRRTQDGDFFPFEDLLGTMLHELVHNEIGPHNAKFYAMLDELQKECDDLMDRGVGGSGAGFDLDGVKLSSEAHNPTSLRDARLKALSAAEERLKKQKLIGTGGRLGGRAPPKDRTPGQMAAEAAMRRLKDDAWCHTGGSSSAEYDGKPATHATESEKHVAEKDSVELNARPNSNKQPTPARSISRSSRDAATGSDCHPPPKKVKLCIGWQCPVCTLQNDASKLRCGACDAPNTSEVCRAGARRLVGRKCRCGQCTEEPTPASSAVQRLCPACTYLNAADGSRNCAMCGAMLVSVRAVSEEVVVLD